MKPYQNKEKAIYYERELFKIVDKYIISHFIFPPVT